MKSVIAPTRFKAATDQSRCKSYRKVNPKVFPDAKS
jgi:hypothetical protein